MASHKVPFSQRGETGGAGLTPREPTAQAALTFVTDVMLQSRDEQEAKDAKVFHDKLMDFIEEFPLR